MVAITWDEIETMGDLDKTLIGPEIHHILALMKGPEENRCPYLMRLENTSTFAELLMVWTEE